MSDETEVLYNDTCPVCQFEIGRYAKHSADQNLPIRYEGISAAEGWGLTPDQAARRLHVRKDGVLLAGLPAFQMLWAEMPRYRWLAKLSALPGIHQIGSFGYDWLAAPVIYRWHLRRQARAALAVSKP